MPMELKLREGISKERLSDRVLFALELALDQEDIELADMLCRALELAMTRNTGGGEFVERRDYPDDIESAMDKLDKLKEERGIRSH